MIEVLYKKKIIRDFLSLFTENYWKQLIGYMLEYSIITFKKHHNIASMSPEDIISIIEKMKKDENLEEKKFTNLIRSRSISKDDKFKSNIKTKPFVTTPQSKSRIRSSTPLKDNILVNKVNKNKKSSSSKKKNAKSFISTKYQNESDNDSQIKSHRNNLKTIKSNKEKILARPKEKVIIEQANLEKLKEKRNKSKIKGNITDDENNTKKKKLFAGVESKIKNVIELDKKNYNKFDKNTKIDKHDKNLYEKKPFIANSTMNKYTYNSNTNFRDINYIDGDRDDSNFEDRLNGLKEKISALENKNISDDNSDDDCIKNIPVKYHTTIKKEKINSSNTHDEDYLSEDQIDLNKYNL